MFHLKNYTTLAELRGNKGIFPRHLHPSQDCWQELVRPDWLGDAASQQQEQTGVWEPGLPPPPGFDPQGHAASAACREPELRAGGCSHRVRAVMCTHSRAHAGPARGLDGGNQGAN